MSTNLTDFLVIGDIYIINGDKPLEKYDAGAKELPKVVKTITSFKDRIKNTVTDTVKPGVIHRPTAGELLSKEMPEEKKQADNAIEKTLDAIPELKKAKEYLEQQK